MNRLARWCIDEGYSLPSWEALILGFLGAVRAEGVPVDRLSISLQVMHPILAALNWIWADGELVCRRHPLANRDASDFLLSPAYRVMNGLDACIHRRIDAAGDEFPIFVELRERGFRDYLALQLLSGDGTRHLLSLATRDAAGYTAGQIAALQEATRVFQILVDRQLQGQLSRTIAETYIGHRTGPRVMAGSIHRGGIGRLRAAIWFSDLRDFTGMSLALGEDGVVELLNAYFGVLGEAVNAGRGEILKFIGDAALVLFPAEGVGDSGACAAALRCLAEVDAQMAAKNAERERAGLPLARHGVGLHLGEVAYGNIGAPDRLDFTVIGPAVNLAARLEGLCAREGVGAALSEDFVQALPPEFAAQVAPIGAFALKGIAAPQAVFRRVAG